MKPINKYIIVEKIKEEFKTESGHTVLIEDKPYTVILERDVVVVL